MDEKTYRLSQITRDLLALDHPGQLRAASIELHALFSGIAGLDDSTLDPLDTTPTVLGAGVAISPLGAARCTLDFARTSKFLRGVQLAVHLAQERFPERPIEILYAGCGPFATLAIPLMTQFTADQVKFTLLDIHERSLAAARRLVRSLGFDAWVREFVEADATTYRHPAERPLHIVVAETMQRALNREPQLEVTLNLAPQLNSGGILIPERITVDACLYNPATEFQIAQVSDSPTSMQRVRITLGHLLDLSLASVARLRDEGLHPVRVELPEAGQAELMLMLRTQVTVLGSIFLGDYDAGITCPHRDRSIDQLTPGSALTFRYQLGTEPGFRIQSAD